jgi:NitT/TauT family transport system substrate-binding protein
MNRAISLLMCLCIVVLILGCAPAEESLKTSGEVMTVAINYWPGQFWIEIAAEKGWFEEEGLHVELIDTNDDYFKGLQDTVDRNIDVNQFVLFDLIEFNLKDANLVAVINSDISSGADAGVATRDIKNLWDLEGRNVGVQKGTFTEFMLDMILNQYGLSAADVSLIEVASDTPQPFVDGTVDVLVTWEPHLSVAVQEGNGHIIFDSTNIPGLIPDVHVFKKQFIEERPEDVQAYVNVWHRTTQFIKSNQDESFGIIAEIYKVPVLEVKELAEHARILDLEANKISFSYAAGFESLHGTAKQINEFMIGEGITDKRLDSTEFIDARFIRNVKEYQ